MGNSSSAAHHPHPHHGLQGQPQRWTHSYPRATSTAASAAASGDLKVLPERVPGQRLRVTNNGAILQNGGTISGRRPSVGNLPRQRSSSQGSHHESKRSLYGSEPDLRYTGREFHHQPYSNDSPAKLRISRSRKKYKAPPAPHINGNAIDSSSPDSYQHWEMSGGGSGGGETAAPSRRLRLFKTRAETKRRGNEEAVTQHSFGQGTPSPGPLQRSLSSPQFQAELLEAAERLRPVREPPVGRAAEETPPRSPELRSIENMSKTDRARNAFRSNFDASHASNHKSHSSNHKSRTSSNENKPVSSAVQRTNELMEELQCRTRSKINKQTLDHRTRGEGSTGRESTPEPQVPRKTPAKNKSKDWESSNGPSKQISPVKTFYFGMGESPTRNEREEVDRFAASLHQRVPRPASKSNSRPINTSGSDSLSSENNDENGSHGISLQLRPILPRKQLDIPRFSPTAAWRLLSALESSPPSEEDDLVPLEERIPVPLHLVNHPGQPDKSGDSGISGDDSPQHQDSTHNSQIAWTPQQDLEETSSDGGLESAPVSPESQSLPAAKFSPRFSLSLPRDDRLALYTHADKISEEAAEPDSFHSLKKLKRSMSGALGRAGGVIKESQGQESLPLDGNWVLSRSVPNSLNNGHSSLQRWASNSTPSSPEQDEEGALTSLVKQPSFSYLATGGHFMYLPEYSLPQKFIQQEYSPASMPLPISMSKSCEDLSRGNDKEKLSSSIIRALEKPRSRSGRKFTFQSTVRQIERRRLAEKLSREAEQKERQRLSELEAMRRVEEEFQRKREREKADIRQQLRLFSLSQGKRDQPDGADPPSPLPPPATQVLSEFQQSRREYRDYRQNNHRSGHIEPDVIQNAEPNHKRAMIHPQVVYQMPKSTQVYVNPHLHSNGSGVGSDNGGGGGGGVGGVSTPRSSSSDNYRRDFAQGALPHSLVSSDSELSQPNTRPTSRNRRSRSASPQRKISDTSDVTSCDAGEIRITQINVIERVARNLNDCFKTTGEFLNASDPSDYPMEYMNNSFGSNVADEGDELTENNQTKTVESREVGEESPSTTRFNIGSAQPFVRGKSYRPIVFNPSINKVAQTAS